MSDITNTLRVPQSKLTSVSIDEPAAVCKTSHNLFKKPLSLEIIPETQETQNTQDDWKYFFEILERKKIKKILEYDQCARFTDCYLIATTAVYFNRIKAAPEEYTIRNFLLLLQLAGEMHEDIDCHEEIYYIGENGNRIKWQKDKNRLWKRLNFRLFVSIEELQNFMEDHVHRIWSRRRSESHGGALRYVNQYVVEQPHDQRHAKCEICAAIGDQQEKQKRVNSRSANIPNRDNRDLEELLVSSDSSLDSGPDSGYDQNIERPSRPDTAEIF